MSARRSNAGYYRLPTIGQDAVVFVSEDDLWIAELDKEAAVNGPARRLSANPGAPTQPCLSANGEWIAFTSREEGMPEVYVMPRDGGTAKRLTYLGANTRLLGWHPHKADTVLFHSDAEQPFPGQFHAYEISYKKGEARPIKVGPIMGISFEPSGQGTVIHRHGGGRGAGDPAMWKRYRGGKAGQLWIDRNGDGTYAPLISLDSDLANPMWIGKRIYFLSDHDGIGNLYSCTPTGKRIKQHTFHDCFYVRHPKTDGKRIVYSNGGDLFVFDPRTDETAALELSTPSSLAQLSRKYADPSRYLESYALHPQGHSMCVITRGKAFAFAHWEGHISQRGESSGSERYRLAHYLDDGKTILAVGDGSGEEQLVYLKEDGSRRSVGKRYNFGRAIELKASPGKLPLVAIANHRNELIILDPSGRKKTKIIDSSEFDRIESLDWSRDGKWLAYTFANSFTTRGIRLYNVQTGKKSDLTNFDFNDHALSFDPQGDYLYFLSYREFDPVYDNHHFDLGFPRGVRLLAIPLRSELASPFLPVPRAPSAPPSPATKPDSKSTKPKPVHIDIKGIQDRVVAAPFGEGRFNGIRAIPGKILFSSFPIEGSLNASWGTTGSPPANGTLEAWDILECKRETLISGISDFLVSSDHKTFAYRAGNRLRVLKAGTKPAPGSSNGGGSAGASPSRANGWIDLNRIKLAVDPAAEWTQMFHEAWRLQRDQYWVADMAGIDWEHVRENYESLLNRVTCRSEFSDLLWELQGELGTSHAYEMGGDYKPTPAYRQGLLGCNLSYDNRAKAWTFGEIPQGDSWIPGASSPLSAPGVHIKSGDRLLAIDRTKLSRLKTPAELLRNAGGQFTQLTVSDGSGRKKRDVTIKCLTSEFGLHYRNWVEANRAYVHRKSRGRVGYIHVPDMGPRGFSQFHRYFLPEMNHDGLIVDVRFNGGGHVSSLLLEKLLRRPLGFTIRRWGQPSSYPHETVVGPIVALTNQNSGSDGDIFSHGFKLANAGPLIGTRTWGGVIGIWPRHWLVDGSMTTQPEFSFWFNDVGFNVENYGTDPDIEVDILPQDHAAHRDPQLDRAIKEAMRRDGNQKTGLPNFGPKPKLGK